MIKVVGKTNPFLVTIASESVAFNIDSFFEIIDSENENPVCRIIKTEHLSKETVKSIEKELAPDIEKFFPDCDHLYIAKAKIENYIKKPIKSGSDVINPDFEKIKPFLINQELSKSLVLGEINGTDIFMDTMPDEYKSLFMVRKEGKPTIQTSAPLLFDYKKLSEAPHIGLFGGSGSGKTFALKVIAEELMKKHIPVILFDPHMEMDFSVPRKDIDRAFQYDFSSDFQIFTIGKDVGIDFKGLSTDELIQILGFASDLSGAMENLLMEVHKDNKTFMSLIDTLNVLKKIKEYQETRNKEKQKLTNEEEAIWDKYGSSVPSSLTVSGLIWRINLINRSGIFDKNIEKIKNALFMKKVCVLRGEMKSLNILGFYLISNLYGLRKNYIDYKDIDPSVPSCVPFIVAMDEAHIFCPKTEQKSPIKTILRTIAQEGRKYGVFEIMATQRPSLLDETVVAQMSTKFIFKLSIKDDLNSVQKETDLSEEEIERLPYINSGETFISSSIYGKTISALIRYNVTNVKAKSNPFDELDEVSLSKEEEFLIKKLPINTLKIVSLANEMSTEGKTYLSSDIINILNNLVKNKVIIKDGNTYKK